MNAQPTPANRADIIWPPPTEQAVEDEISLLRKLTERFPPVNRFGESNTLMLGAQIEVLENGTTITEVADDLEDEDVSILTCAAIAADWLAGEDPVPPSHGWLSLLGEATNRHIN